MVSESAAAWTTDLMEKVVEGEREIRSSKFDKKEKIVPAPLVSSQVNKLVTTSEARTAPSFESLTSKFF